MHPNASVWRSADYPISRGTSGSVLSATRSSRHASAMAARRGRASEILRQALFGGVEPAFEKLAAELRKLTRRRKRTRLEILLRQGREELRTRSSLTPA